MSLLSSLLNGQCTWFTLEWNMSDRKRNTTGEGGQASDSKPLALYSLMLIDLLCVVITDSQEQYLYCITRASLTIICKKDAVNTAVHSKF